METLRHSKPKARKEHVCNFCDQAILKGETYDNQVNIYDDIYVWKSHIRCAKIAQKLNMYNECGEHGLTGDEFQEFINETYYCLIEHDEETDFKARLEHVMKHYKIDYDKT